ncbi:hypothetical protein GGS20DRAFT_551589 [Poronia punctata]|nr:hypothetical protein GGS20DRAFT_551589 [Poronia punctata]
MDSQYLEDCELVDEIPPLSSVGPSIFVPTDRDWAKTPPALPENPLAALEDSLREFDRHAQYVEENMLRMFAQEAERIRRTASFHPVPWDTHGRHYTDDEILTEPDLLYEEALIREDEPAVLKIMGDDEYKDWKESSRKPDDLRFRGRHGPAAAWTSLGPSVSGEYADLDTVREDMYRVTVDEERMTPREAALAHVLNLVKWGWDDQIRSHRAAVEKEKEDLRAELRRAMASNSAPVASPIPVPPTSAPVDDSVGEGVDSMDFEE